VSSLDHDHGDALPLLLAQGVSAPLELQGKRVPLNEPSIRRVLCAVDVARPALGALRRGIQIAQRFEASCEAMYARDPRPQLRLATLTPCIDVFVSHFDAEERLGRLLDGEGGATAARHSIEGLPSSTILARSALTNTDLIVLGWNPDEEDERRRPGPARIVASRAGCSVLTVAGESRGSDIRTIVVPLDFSSVTETVLSWALAFARQFGAGVHLMHILERLAVTTAKKSLQRAATSVQAAVARLEHFGIPTTGEIVRSDVGTARTIVERSSARGVDLLILGAHRVLPGHAGVEGTVAAVRRDVGIPVLSVRTSGFRVERLTRGGVERGGRDVGAA
jgi:nucleotide-binding universal stress UspA family protein